MAASASKGQDAEAHVHTLQGSRYSSGVFAMGKVLCRWPACLGWVIQFALMYKLP